MAEILEIKVKKNYENISFEVINSVVLLKDYGLSIDINGGKPGRNVSILNKKAREKLKSANIKGICFDRFYENITISEDLKMNVGDIIRINDAEIVIKSKGKRCFENCEVYKKKFDCPLKEVCFGDVIKPGVIYVGDKIYHEPICKGL